MERGGILIAVQNLSVPRDRRVWAECRALTAAGRRVSVICPRGPGEAAEELLDGVWIHRYRPPPPTKGVLSFVWEFAYSWIQTLRLSVTVWRRRRFDVLQACNPPDTLFALAWIWKLFGVRFVYDQHDLCPELYLARFKSPRAVIHRSLLLLERLTYLTADHVIATNRSYRARALGRGKKRPEDVTVVRNGPDTSAFRRVAEVPALRRGRTHLCCWVGVMGPQDGVDLLVEAIDHYVNALDRHDCSFAILGTGDCYGEMVAKVDALGLGRYVELPGWADTQTLVSYLSTASVGLGCDPLNEFNNVSTMNKTMEYMAFGLPVVCFDLAETRESAGDCAAFVPANDVPKFARTIADLIDDPEARSRMAVSARARAETVLDWRRQVPGYLAVFDRLIGTAPSSARDVALRHQGL